MMTVPLGSRISPDNNLTYLPFAYFLPEDLYYRFPTLRKIPRTLGELFFNGELMGLVNSDQFLNDVWNAIAILVFPHLGFKGRLVDYTGYSPLCRIVYTHLAWAELLAEEADWGIDLLLRIPYGTYIPFFEPDDIKKTMAVLAKRVLMHKIIRGILKTMREMPCDEDFQPRYSKVRIDFYRQWYHTRTKVGLMLSLDEVMHSDDEEADDFYSVVPTDEFSITDWIDEEDYCQRFKNMLSERDREILEMRELGITYAEIAEKLGYKTHSAVIKRMKAIKEVFLKFQEKNK